MPRAVATEARPARKSRPYRRRTEERIIKVTNTAALLLRLGLVEPYKPKWWTQTSKPIDCRDKPSISFFAAGLFWALAPTMAIAGDCLSHPVPFRLQSDTVQWSMVIARGDECIQGLRGKTMIFESASIVEQPKRGRVVLQGPSFRY